jgi:hypothetical protein
MSGDYAWMVANFVLVAVVSWLMGGVSYLLDCNSIFVGLDYLSPVAVRLGSSEKTRKHSAI